MITSAGETISGEFWRFIAVFCVARALVFWHFRDRVPNQPADGI